MRRLVRSALVVAFTFIFSTAWGQNQPKADSFLYMIENEKLSMVEKMEAYYWLAAYSSSPDDELKYGLVLLDLANKSDNQEYIMKANQRIGVAHRLKGNLGEALKYLYLSGNQAVGQEKFNSFLADIYGEISTCYTQNGDSKNALLYGLKSIEMLRKTDRIQELALNLLNAGYDYYLIGKYDSALSYLNESESILMELKMPIGLAYITGNRALVYWKKGFRDKAKEDLNYAIKALEPYGDQFGIADYYNQLGNIHLEEGDYEKAKFNVTRGYEIALEEGYKEQIRDASYLLFLIYLNEDDFKHAINYQIKFYAYKDSIQNLQTTQQIANLRTDFELGRQQAELDRLIEQKRSNQIVMGTGGIILLIVICLVILVYSYYKSKTKLNKQLEEQKDSLITLNNTKDKFFSIISHDLRGPANVLSGLVSVIKKDLDEVKTEELREMLDHMEHSAEHLVSLLDNLLNWALQQRGHFPYIPERLTLRNILSEVTDMYMEMAASKGIKLEMHIEEDITLFVDKNATSTIFRNLLNNAIKFTPNGGNVLIKALKNSESGHGIIEFIDDGVGISEDKMQSLFTLNENVATKGTSGERGLGLGLQLVHDFVHLNKGEVKVESKEGQGSTFIVHLPLYVLEEQAVN